jgi:hypothetical protein
MLDTSASCPEIRRRNWDQAVAISDDFNDPSGGRVRIEHYDLDSFIEQMITLRNTMHNDGVMTAWSQDADGQGNCGPIQGVGAVDLLGVVVDGATGV